MIGFVQARLQQVFWTAFYKAIGRYMFKEVGRGVIIEGWIDIPQRGGQISLGAGAHICRLVEFSIPRGGELIIGSGVFIGRGVVVSAHQLVEIGANTMIGESVSIHDNNHCTSDLNQPISKQGFTSEPLHIGTNCWIGSHSVLVKGSSLEAGCIVGAGAVVTRKYPERTKVLGVPAVPVKDRLETRPQII
jgi:acetyltransferase-like isoleucine patch superfamily enzyme